MTAREYLHLLFKDKPPELHILTWTIQDGVKLSHWRRHPDDASEVVAAFPNADVYIGLSLSPKDFGPHARCLANQTAGIGCIWMDIDLASDAHSGKSLPKTIEEALSILPLEMPPSLVIFTGNGLHIYWFFKEILIFENAEERERVHRTIWRWQTLLCQIASTKGWRLDRLSDLARVLRPPGTRNFKDRSAPKPVVVHQMSERRYNLDEFVWLLDQMGVAEPDAAGPAQATATPAAIVAAPIPPATGTGLEGDYEIRLNAAIPEETLNLWLESDLQFFKTWNKLRDREFPSPSEYDLALSNFALALRLPAQTAVDLITHWRRLQAKRDPRIRPRTRRDYFDRTLARARTSSLPGKVPAPVPSETEERPAAGTAPTNGSGAAEAAPPDGKQTLAEWISRQLEFSVPVLRFVKITGNPPTYQIEFADGARIALHDVGDLINQDRLRYAIAASPLNHLMPAFKPLAWKPIVQAILKCLTEVEGGDESELGGMLRLRLERYLYTANFAIDGDYSARTSQLPCVIDGQIAISTQHLQRELNFEHVRLSVREITSELIALGAKQRRIRQKSRDYSRWLLPVETFPPDDYKAAAAVRDRQNNTEPERKPN